MTLSLSARVSFRLAALDGRPRAVQSSLCPSGQAQFIAAVALTADAIVAAAVVTPASLLLLLLAISSKNNLSLLVHSYRRSFCIIMSVGMFLLLLLIGLFFCDLLCTYTRR